MGKWSLKNVFAVGSAPFTGGASLLGMENADADAGTASAVAGGSMFPTAALGMASSVFDNVYNNYASRKATKAQNEWNLAQWERENAYNHPAEIMKRYQEAGLNPNLIYGQAYESPAHLESAKQQVVPLDSMHNLLAMYNLDAQNQLLHAQREEVKARTNLIRTQDTNWTVDHTNWSREFIDFFKGLFGIDQDKRLGGESGKFVRDLAKELPDLIFDLDSPKDVILTPEQRRHNNLFRYMGVK